MCQYCEGKETKNLIKEESIYEHWCYVFIEGNKLNLEVSIADRNGCCKNIEINYCPMCSKELIGNNI